MRTINDAMNFIYSTTWKGSVLGLERISELMLRLGGPQKKLRFVHIAGTNGKGSTAAMLAGVLGAAGYKTGLYTSPYVYKFNEMIQVGGAAVSDDELISLADEVRRAAAEMDDAPTEYEIITALAFVHFLREECDIVVLEVGMGGRIDTTNVIDTPEVAVITAIGLDHMKQLGGTVEKIAGEKAGIIKGGSVVSHPQDASVERVLRKKCAETGAAATFVREENILLEEINPDGQKFTYCGKNFAILLLGGHQLRNAAVAIETVEILRARGWEISEAALHDGLRNTVWPGRFEILRRKPLFITDVAHNPQGISATLATFRTLFPEKKPVFLFGVLADKDFTEMARLLSPQAKKFVLVTPDSSRALPAAELKKYVTGNAVDYDSVSAGVAHALETAAPDDAIIALGSLSMIGKIRKLALDTFKKLG